MDFINSLHDKNGNPLKMIIRYDSYMNATILCKSAGVDWKEYFKLQETQEFLEELSKTVEKPIDHVKKGILENRGIWVHKQVAINLAMWISPEFEARCMDVVKRYYAGTIKEGESQEVAETAAEQQKIVAGVHVSRVPVVIDKTSLKKKPSMTNFISTKMSKPPVMMDIGTQTDR